MFVKKVLCGVAIVGALAVLPAAASAHEYYHHHYYRPYYYPTYYPPVVVTPAPVVVPAPVIVTPAAPVDVFYRGAINQTWTLYGTYNSRYDADQAARSLERSGYSIMVQLR
jgi:hypothetical protein